MYDGYMGYGPMGMNDENIGDNGMGTFGMHALGGYNRNMPGVSNMYSPDAQIYYSSGNNGQEVSSLQSFRDPTYSLQETSIFDIIKMSEPIFKQVDLGTLQENRQASYNLEAQAFYSDLKINAAEAIGTVASLAGGFIPGPLGIGVQAIGTAVSMGAGAFKESSQENFRNMIELSGMTNSMVGDDGKRGQDDRDNGYLLRGLGEDASQDLMMDREDNMELIKSMYSEGLMSGANDAQGALDTFKKVKKALKTVSDVIGSTDLKETLQEISKMRQHGFSLNQATEAIGGLKVAADIAGVKKKDINDLHTSAMFMSGERTASVQDITREVISSLVQQKSLQSISEGSGRLSNNKAYVMADQEINAASEKVMQSNSGFDSNKVKIMAMEMAKESGSDAQEELDRLMSMSSDQIAAERKDFIESRKDSDKHYYAQVMSSPSMAKAIVAALPAASSLDVGDIAELAITDAITKVKKSGTTVTKNSVFAQLMTNEDMQDVSSTGQELLMKKIEVELSPSARQRKENAAQNAENILLMTELSSKKRRAEEAQSLTGSLSRGWSYVGNYFHNLTGNQESVAKIGREATEVLGNIGYTRNSIYTYGKDKKENERHSAIMSGTASPEVFEEAVSFYNKKMKNEDGDNYLDAVKRDIKEDKYNHSVRDYQDKNMDEDLYEDVILFDMVATNGAGRWTREFFAWDSTKDKVAKVEAMKMDALGQVNSDIKKTYESMNREDKDSTVKVFEELKNVRDASSSELTESEKELKYQLRGKTNDALKNVATAMVSGQTEQYINEATKHLPEESWFSTNMNDLDLKSGIISNEALAALTKNKDSLLDKTAVNITENASKMDYNKGVYNIIDTAGSQEVSRIMTLMKREGYTNKQLDDAISVVDPESDVAIELYEARKLRATTHDKGIQMERYKSATDEMKYFSKQTSTIKKVALRTVEFAKKIKEDSGFELAGVSIDEISEGLADDGAESEYTQYLSTKDKKKVQADSEFLRENLTNLYFGGTREEVLQGAREMSELSSSMMRDEENNILEAKAQDVIDKAGLTDFTIDEVLNDMQRVSSGEKGIIDTLQSKYGDKNIGKYMSQAIALGDADVSASKHLQDVGKNINSKGDLEAEKLKQQMITNELLAEIGKTLSE